MPFVHIAVPHVLMEPAVAAISEAIHAALVEAFNVPLADRFQVISRHPPGELICTPEYLGIAHSDHVALVQITVSAVRHLTAVG